MSMSHSARACAQADSIEPLDHPPPTRRTAGARTASGSGCCLLIRALLHGHRVLRVAQRVSTLDSRAACIPCKDPSTASPSSNVSKIAAIPTMRIPLPLSKRGWKFPQPTARRLHLLRSLRYPQSMRHKQDIGRWHQSWSRRAAWIGSLVLSASSALSQLSAVET